MFLFIFAVGIGAGIYFQDYLNTDLIIYEASAETDASGTNYPSGRQPMEIKDGKYP